MAFASKPIASSPALVCLAMALVLVLVASTKAQRPPPILLPPTPALTPAPAPAPSCPAGFANMSSFEEAKPELSKKGIDLFFKSNDSTAIGIGTTKPKPGTTQCVCRYYGGSVDDLIGITGDITFDLELGVLVCERYVVL